MPVIRFGISFWGGDGRYTGAGACVRRSKIGLAGFEGLAGLFVP